MEGKRGVMDMAEQDKELQEKMLHEKMLHEKQLDAFWDISDLIPVKKKIFQRPRPSIELAEVVSDTPDVSQTDDHGEKAAQQTLSAPHSDSGTVIKRYIPPHTEKEMTPPKPDDSYRPEGSLLHEVRIYRWKTNFQYYEDFCRDAMRLSSCHGEACDPVPFFSYVPQYSQMNREQLSWYLYWREQARRGIFLPTDYTYILLYIYEIINLSDVIDPAAGQAQLTALREAYGRDHPRLLSYLNEWICDYSLIHHLPPVNCDKLWPIAGTCSLREFYVPVSEDDNALYAKALIAFASNYDYQKSKFATGEAKALYDLHMTGAIRACLCDPGAVGQKLAQVRQEQSRLIRDAYTGALCSHRIKRRIEVDYCSFARSHELRILVTDMLKYTENKLRAYLGVKSRLGLFGLPPEFRTCIDGYMQRSLPATGRERTVGGAESRQAFEALYDLPQTAFSVENARQIERDSWKTTEALVEAFGTDGAEGEQQQEQEQKQKQEPKQEQKTSKPLDEAKGQRTVDICKAKLKLPAGATSDAVNNTVGEALSEEDLLATFRSALGEDYHFVELARQKDYAGQRQFCRKTGVMPESLVDSINETAADLLGDILLEENEDGYEVIPDYLSLWERMGQE